MGVAIAVLRDLTTAVIELELGSHEVVGSSDFVLVDVSIVKLDVLVVFQAVAAVRAVVMIANCSDLDLLGF